MTHTSNRLVLVCAVALALVAAACGSDGHGAGAGPAAPSNLRAAVVGGGAHLTWEDNSDDETEFVVMRKAMAATSYTAVTTAPFNTVQYHDASVTAGMTYVYHVMAMNADGETASNEITFTAP